MFMPYIENPYIVQQITFRLLKNRKMGPWPVLYLVACKLLHSRELVARKYRGKWFLYHFWTAVSWHFLCERMGWYARFYPILVGHFVSTLCIFDATIYYHLLPFTTIYYHLLLSTNRLLLITTYSTICCCYMRLHTAYRYSPLFLGVPATTYHYLLLPRTDYYLLITAYYYFGNYYYYCHYYHSYLLQ